MVSVESELFTFALNNGVGVLFGILMYIMTNNMRKENAAAITSLKEAIDKLIEVLGKKL
jgi:hypothetical protein